MDTCRDGRPDKLEAPKHPIVDRENDPPFGSLFINAQVSTNGRALRDGRQADVQTKWLRKLQERFGDQVFILVRRL